MRKKLLLTGFFITLLFLSSCFKKVDTDVSSKQVTPTVAPTQMLPQNSPTPIITSKPVNNNKRVTLDKKSDNMLGHYGNTQYFWRMEKDDCVLYSIDDKQIYAKQLAIFPPMVSGDSDSDSRIIDFGGCGDWLIASVGDYQGSGNYFYGDFVRLKKDGSELAHFYLTDDGTFVIIDDWIYYNYWTNEENPENDAYGCYRIRPDGTENEYLGNVIYEILLYKNGLIYGEHATSKTVNGWNPVMDLICCKADGSKLVTLFKGDCLPKFENSDYIEYYDIKVTKNNVKFTVGVHGDSEGDSWRGHFLYTAQYSVRNDSSHLTLLNEETDK